MRRKSTREKPGYDYFDFLTEVDPERLRLMAAANLAWNWIEGSVDAALAYALRLDEHLKLDVITRINGMDGKIEIIRRSLTDWNPVPLADAEDAAIRATLGAVEVAKTYRDGVIHARVFHRTEPVVDTSQRRGKIDEVLVSREALEWLYAYLSVVGAEMDMVATITFYRTFMARVPLYSADLRARAFTQMKQPMTLLHETQNERASLSPPPKFPDPPQAPPAREAAPTPTG